MRNGSPEYRRATWAMLAFGLAIFNTLYATQALLPTLTPALGVMGSSILGAGTGWAYESLPWAGFIGALAALTVAAAALWRGTQH